ncbi:hypothetical protein QYE76_010019 [Lolium multiflorum]|uniref:Reverse transcriptase zinc-binding domain-containing protein n=1 Tax=Lolium multiflorum TaxID=4521 RepID=A0AAD8TUS8_LOLMU|nr:hypothetical protein QYE76_010019 [Lolium multiflorum]
MPELLSHSTAPSATVQQVLRAGLDSLLVARLSSTAERQRGELMVLLGSIHLSPAADRRTLPLCAREGGRLKTGALYKLCSDGGVRDENATFVWHNSAPPRVKFFAWLLVKGRIQCRSNLLRKGILEEDGSRCPICDAHLETPAHIMFHCSFARQFWAALGSPPVADGATLGVASVCPLPATAPARSASTLRLLCFWHLWKHRNSVVFEGLSPSLSWIRKRCRDDATLWRARLPLDHRADVDLWLTYLPPVRL